MRVGIFSVVVVMSSCGSAEGVVTSPLTSSCAVATDTYVSEATLRSKDGQCPKAKGHSRDRLEFDQGTFVSPAAAIMSCTTEQIECTITVTCRAFAQKMVFTGAILDEGARLAGVVTFTGEPDCRSTVYDMEATRPAP